MDQWKKIATEEEIVMNFVSIAIANVECLFTVYHHWSVHLPLSLDRPELLAGHHPAEFSEGGILCFLVPLL